MEGRNLVVEQWVLLIRPKKNTVECVIHLKNGTEAMTCSHTIIAEMAQDFRENQVRKNEIT